MNFIKLYNKNIGESLKPIDAESLKKLADVAIKCDYDVTITGVRDILYESIYQATGLEAKEKDLENYLELVKKKFNVDTKNQNDCYNHVDTNLSNLKFIYYRFYIAPRPENIHELVKELANLFGHYNIPIKFKYQLTAGMKRCDRIIIYIDKPYRNMVEQLILNIYQRKPYLFKGAERAAAWIYDTKIPGVYMSTGCPASSYGREVCISIQHAKDIFRYLYGINASNPERTFSGNGVVKVYHDLETLIASTMLRRGLLLSKDDMMLAPTENFKVFYDYDTGILRYILKTTHGDVTIVDFLPNAYGRKALIDNFYSASNVKPQIGVKVEHLKWKEYCEKVEEESRIKSERNFRGLNKKRN